MPWSCHSVQHALECSERTHDTHYHTAVRRGLSWSASWRTLDACGQCAASTPVATVAAPEKPARHDEREHGNLLQYGMESSLSMLHQSSRSLHLGHDAASTAKENLVVLTA